MKSLIVHIQCNSCIIVKISIHFCTNIYSRQLTNFKHVFDTAQKAPSLSLKYLHIVQWNSQCQYSFIITFGIYTICIHTVITTFRQSSLWIFPFTLKSIILHCVLGRILRWTMVLLIHWANRTRLFSRIGAGHWEIVHLRRVPVNQWTIRGRRGSLRDETAVYRRPSATAPLDYDHVVVELYLSSILSASATVAQYARCCSADHLAWHDSVRIKWSYGHPGAVRLYTGWLTG